MSSRSLSDTGMQWPRRHFSMILSHNSFGCQTHSQVFRAKGLNSRPLSNETESLPQGHRSLWLRFDMTPWPGLSLFLWPNGRNCWIPLSKHTASSNFFAEKKSTLYNWVCRFSGARSWWWIFLMWLMIDRLKSFSAELLQCSNVYRHRNDHDSDMTWPLPLTHTMTTSLSQMQIATMYLYLLIPYLILLSC